MPERVQRKRTKGFRLPQNTVCVTRPGKWGNPFSAAAYLAAGYKATPIEAAQVCTEAYRLWLEGKHHWAHGNPMPPPPDIAKLRGKNLACWCKVGNPCHADVILELANG